MKLIDYQKAYEKDKSNTKIKNEYLKACYQVLKESNGYKNEIKDRAIYEGISPSLIQKNTKEYLVIVKHIMTEEEYQELIHLRILQKYKLPLIRNNPCNELLLNLMGIDNEEQIINLIENSTVDYKYLRRRIRDFINVYYPNKEYLIEVLRYKVNVYIEYKQKLKKEEKEKNDTISMDSIIVNKLKQMIYFIEHGIKCDNGTIRPFDVIDYYQFIGLNIKELFWYLDTDEFSAHEYTQIKKLIYPGGILEKINKKNYIETEKQLIRNVLNSTEEVNCKKDAKGNPIIGTGRIIDLGEKEKIINFLRDIGAPLTRKNYTVACRRYVNGTLLFDKEETKNFYKKRIISNS